MSSSVLIAVMPAERVQAQLSRKTHPVEAAIVYQAFWGFWHCSNQHDWETSRDVNDLREMDVFNGVSGSYRPSWIRANSNSEGKCHEGKNTSEMFEHMGIDPLDFVTTDFGNGAIYIASESGYKLNEDISKPDRLAYLAGFIAQTVDPDLNVLQLSMPPAEQYFTMQAHFSQQCIEAEGIQPSQGGTAIRMVDSEGAEKTINVRVKNSSYEVAYGLGTRNADNRWEGSTFNCNDMAAFLNNNATATVAAIAAWRAANPTTAPPSAVNPGGTEEDTSCETSSGTLGWIMCPVAGILDTAVGFLDEQIRDLLILNSDQYFHGESDLKQSWARLRNIAFAMLVPIMLVMVIGTALGAEIFSAYTVKKALPRMVVAVIFISLSWYICLFLVDFVNVVGSGMKGIITGPFGISSEQTPLRAALTNAEVVTTGDSSLERISSEVTAGGIGIMSVAAGWMAGALSLGIIMSTLGTAALVLGGVFLLLIARQMILIALFLIAPLAILAWIFPNNDKLWKLWWGSFSKLLMLYPLIMLLLGVGEIFAHVTGTARAEDNKLVTSIIVIGAFVMPFFFIPFAFKWAGGVFGNLAGMVNDKERGALDRLRKGRSESRAKGFQNFKTGTGTRFSQRNALTRGIGQRVGSRTLGVGEKGRKKLADLNSANVASNIKENQSLNQLAVSSDEGIAINALSGGTRSGAEAASQDLKRGWLRDNAEYNAVGTSAQRRSEIEANIEERRKTGLAHAKAAGLNRTNAQSAMQLMMQNKARSVGGGDWDTVQNGIDRLHGAGTRGAIDTAENIAYMGRTGSRADLGDANGSVQRGIERAGMSNVVRGHTSTVRTASQDITSRYQTSIANGDLEGASQAASQMVAMRNSLGQDVSDDNKSIVYEMLSQAGIDVSAPETVSQQLGAMTEHNLNMNTPGRAALSASGLDASTLSNDIDTRAGVYERGTLLAGGGSSGSSGGGTPSDIRLKRNFKVIDRTEEGIKLYRFQYVWGENVYVGVMAQDLLHSHPNAVHVGSDGFYSVDYDALGLQMVTLEDWESAV